VGGLPAPQWRNQRIGHALDEPYEPVEDRCRQAHDQKRGAEADEAAGQYVGGVVGTDEDA
jgi:hypothetical protein